MFLTLENFTFVSENQINNISIPSYNYIFHSSGRYCCKAPEERPRTVQTIIADMRKRAYAEKEDVSMDTTKINIEMTRTESRQSRPPHDTFSKSSKSY